jgi:hypothetical protein
VVGDILDLLWQRGQPLGLQDATQLSGGSRRRANPLHQNGEDQWHGQMVGQDGGGSRHRVGLAAPLPLGPLPCRIGGEVDGLAAQSAARQEGLLGEPCQEVGDGGAQQVGEFIGAGTSGRLEDQSDEGSGEGAVSGEADGAIEPQAVSVEAGRPAKGVVASVMVETGVVAVRLQGAEDRHVRKGQGRANSSKRGNGPARKVGQNSGVSGCLRHLL